MTILKATLERDLSSKNGQLFNSISFISIGCLIHFKNLMRAFYEKINSLYIIYLDACLCVIR